MIGPLMYVCPECGSSNPAPGFCTTDGAALDDGSRDTLLGQTVGSYRIARMIGAGGMGEVYRGVQPQIGSRVAIKVLSYDCAKSQALVDRFFAEARAVNVIRHDNIVNVIDLAALKDGRPYIVMEHLEGEPLSAIVRRLGPLPLGTLARLMVEVLDALGAAHAKGIVHRDLKPDNVFVTQSGRAKVLDFGIAKLRPDVAEIADATRTGSLLGTPHYMSPEQALGRGVDPRSDLYSVGVILYECATRKKPFDASTLYELLRQHVEHQPAPPRSLRPDMPPAYETVVLRALEKDPLRRFQSAAEFSSALGQAATHVPPGGWGTIAGGTSVPHAVGIAPTGAPGQSGPFAGQGVPQFTPGAMTPLALGSPGSGTPATAPSPGGGIPFNFPTPVALGTAGGLSNTLTPEAAAPLRESGASAGTKLGFFAVATCGVLALAAMGTLVVLAIIGLAVGDEEEPTTEDPEAPEIPTAPAAPQRESGFGGFDKKRFDMFGFLPRAEITAKKHYADAQLVRLDGNGVNPQGLLDLTHGYEFYVLYRFRSPKHSERPADHPVNVEYQSNCVVYVMVNKDGISSFVPEKTSCELPLIGKPRCSPAQIWRAAAERGAQTGNYVGMIGWWADDRGRGRWYLNITGGFSNFLPDEC